MIGYKAFDNNLCCRGMQYEVGKTYEKTNDRLELCTDSVFHFCRLIENIEKTSDYKLSECRVCEVIAEGEIVTDEIKYGTKKLFILRELSREEIDKYRNTGYSNTGDWNTGDRNTGYLNTNSPFIRMFNKDTNIKFHERNFEFPDFMFFDTTVWVSHDTATQKEKEEHKEEIECFGGFLKEIPYQEAFKMSWDKASKEEHKKLFDLPNWDNEIFKEIFGIDAEAEIKKEQGE